MATVERAPGVIQSPARAASALTTAPAYRQALREVFQTYVTPQRFRKVLDSLYKVATEGKGAEQFRASDLLLRMALGNPSVHGDGELGGADADEAARVRALMAALPPGYAIVHAAGTAPPAAPGQYAPIDAAPPQPAPAPPASTREMPLS